MNLAFYTERLAGLLSCRPARLCMAAAPEGQARSGHAKAHTAFASILILILLLLTPLMSHAVPNGTRILNQASATYDAGYEIRHTSDFNIERTSDSNIVPTDIITVCTDSDIEFMKYAPDHPDAEAINVDPTFFSTSGAPAGPFEEIDPPVPFGSDVPIDLDSPVSLISDVDFYHAGEPFFLRITDTNRNMDSLAKETVYTSITVYDTGDSEFIRLTETGPDTGIFTGYIPSENDRSAAVNNGMLTITVESEIGAVYTDDLVACAGDTSAISVLVDPSLSELWLTKSASKDVVAVGDFLQYTLELENLTASQILGVEIEDRLPLGFRYQEGSLKIDDTDSPGPAVSSDGRTIIIPVGDIPAAATVSIKYVVEVSAGARLGDAINTAVASSVSGFTSNIASATVVVKEDLFRSKSFIIGRVIVDNCEDDEMEENDGAESIRIYMEDGTYTLTDKEGKYHFEGVEPGVHVVQLDVESLSEKYWVVPAEENSRYAGRSFSQFVDLQGGTMWRADFHLSLKPRVRGKVNAAVRISQTDSSLDHTLTVHNTDVPLRNLRVTVLLPEGTEYIEGSSRFDDKPLQEPALLYGTLTYRLGDVPPDRLLKIRFRTDTGGIADRPEGTKLALTFDTPSQKDQRMNLGDEDDSVTSETVGLRPGEEWERPAVADLLPKMIFLNREWVESASPGLEWLWPQPGYNPRIPGLKVFVKHAVGDKIKLLLNGQEVGPLKYEGSVMNNSGSLAVSYWKGMNLSDGDNLFEVITFDAEGNQTGRLEHTVHYSGAPVKAELVAEESTLVADGITPPVIAVRFFDRQGYPVREDASGALNINPPYELFEKIQAYENDPLSGLDREEPGYKVGRDGIAKIMLQPTSNSGKVMLKFSFINDDQEVSAWLKPGEREWILVGLAEGTVGYNTVSGNMENLDESDVKDKFYQDGRVALFAKGKIKGKWLLTLAYDSERERDEEHDSLFRTIDPDTYYTLYGDASRQRYDAASAEKLYVKLERDEFYAMFGDYNTGLTVTELSRYNRSFNGLRTELQTERFSLNLFAAETGQGFIKDEIRGDGTSGLYHLSSRNIVLNSEKIFIETRDRFRSEVIIESRILSRQTDYNIDYDAGTIFFREPVFSKDENLNPIYIVVDYESNDPDAAGEYTYGGRGALRFMDNRLETGATYIHEGRTGNEGDLFGADITLNLTEDTTIKAEYASTDTDEPGGSTAGEAYTAEIKHISEKLDVSLYFRQQNEDFGLDQQNMSESGTRKAGAEARYRLNDMLSITGQAYRQKSYLSDSDRDLAEVGIDYYSGSYGIRSGLRHVEDTLEDGTVNRSLQATLGASKALFDNRLILRADREQSIGGNNESVDFPTRTTLGADYSLTAPVTLFVEHEFTDGENLDTEDTRIGMKARPWEGGNANTYLTRQYDKDGARVFATMGLAQTWHYSNKWSFDGGLDHSRTIKNDKEVTSLSSASDKDFTAITLGATYREEKWTWNWRGEARHSDTEEKYSLLTGIYGEVRKGLGISTSLQLFTTDTDSGTDTLFGNLRLGLAYRPRNTEWIVLDRLDFYFEEQNGPDTDYSSWKIVNNMNANYKPNMENQISFQYGAKYVKDTFDGKSYSGFTDLIGIEARHDITKRWDVGARGSLLHSWRSNQYDYSAGLSVGCNIVTNAWVSLGYNFLGFVDSDFSGSRYTAQGPFMQFRMKFDQYSIKDITKRFSENNEN